MTWGGLDSIFNPGSSHFRDELERQRNEVHVPGNEGPGGKNSVDLDKGVVRIVRTTPQDAAPQDALPEPQDAPPHDEPHDEPQDA